MWLRDSIVGGFLVMTALLLGARATVAADSGNVREVGGPVLYPEWMPFINVKDFGAKGDGKTDDTDAIQNAIKSDRGDTELFFPAGTYLVSRTLVGVTDKDVPRCWLQFYGEGKGRSIIKLKDNASDFQDADKPAPVIWFRGMITSESGTAREQPNVAFFNSVYDMTIDVGSGNPGAVGIDWIVCNAGTLRHVEVVSSDPQKRGFAGVRMNRNDGTAYIQDLTIEGFDYGWYRADGAQSMGVEQLTLRQQRKAGIYNDDTVLAIRDLASDNSVPTLVQKGFAQASILEARISGGASAAFVNESAQAMLYLRNVTTTGAKQMVQLPDAAPKPAPQTQRLEGEWFSHPSVAGSAAGGSLCLPVKVAPDYHSNDFSTWVNVADFSDDDTGDWSRRLQKAIDSGAQTIVMDGRGSGKYNSSVVVRNNVKRVLGLWQSSKTGDKTTYVRGYGNSAERLREALAQGPDAAEKAFFLRVDKTNGNAPVILEQFHHWPGAVLNNSPKPLVIRDMGWMAGYMNTPEATGDFFIEGTNNCNFWIAHGQHAYARSVDAVFGPGPDFRVDNATVWILSNRTEGGGVFVEALNGARVEIISTSHFIGSRGKGDDLAYRIDNSDFSLVNFSEQGFVARGLKYDRLIADTQGGREILVDRETENVLRRKNLNMFMFYRSPGQE